MTAEARDFNPNGSPNAKPGVQEQMMMFTDCLTQAVINALNTPVPVQRWDHDKDREETVLVSPVQMMQDLMQAIEENTDVAQETLDAMAGEEEEEEEIPMPRRKKRKR